MLFALVWLSCVWFGSWSLNPNNATRMFAALSLVEQGDATIDEYEQLSIDKAQFGGHYYMDKAPGMTLLSLPAVALADWVSPPPPVIPSTVYDPPLERFMTVRLRLAVALVSALITALAALALHDLAFRLTGSASAALFASLGYALGTPVWGWSTTIFGHAPVAGLYVIAVWALWRGGEGQVSKAGAIRFAAIGGAVLGLAALIEFQAALAGAIIALWGAWRLWPSDWRAIGAAAVAGAATLLIPFIAYNLIAFGTPFKLGYSGVVGFAGMNEGLFGLTFPKPIVFEQITIGMRRGLLWVAPILLVAPVGLWAMRKAQRSLAITLAVGALVVLLVNSAYVYWDGGHSTGPRHSIPAVGLLAIGLAPFWAGLKYGWERVLAGTLLGVSILINLLVAAANITAPDTYDFPLFDPILTDWRNSFLRTLPGDFLGWSAYQGVALYLALAVPFAVLLLANVQRSAKTSEAT